MFKHEWKTFKSKPSCIFMRKLLNKGVIPATGYAAPRPSHCVQVNLRSYKMVRCLNLEFLPSVLHTCCQLQTGQAMLILGTATKLGQVEDSEENLDVIKINIKRHPDVICFSLEGLEKLQDICHCSFTVLDKAKDEEDFDAAPCSCEHERKYGKAAGKARKKTSKLKRSIEEHEDSTNLQEGEHYSTGSDLVCEQQDSHEADVHAKEDFITDVNKVTTKLQKEDSLKVTPVVSDHKTNNWKRKKKMTAGCHSDMELYILNKAAILEKKGLSDDSDLKQECLLCGQPFTQVYNLPRHIQHYHGVSVKEYKDLLKYPTEEQQERISAFWQLVSFHSEHDIQDDESNQHCHYCGERHSGLLAMRYHLKTKHPEQVGLANKTQDSSLDTRLGLSSRSKDRRGFPCRYCGMKLAFICSRSRHENYYCAMNPNRKKLFCCSRCSKCFTTSKEMLQHKMTHRPDDSKFVCDVCGKVRNTKSGLYQHKMKEHSSAGNRYSCHFCQKTFFAKDKYHRHLTVHIDSRPFVCELCGKTFKTKQAVDKHQRSVHDNKYPYHCSRCGHGMEKLQYLKSHRCGHVRRTQNSEHSDGCTESTVECAVDTYQPERAATQYCLPEAPSVIGMQQVTYADLHQVAVQADIQQHGVPEENANEDYAFQLGVPFSQYTQSYMQIPETDRLQINMNDVNTNNISANDLINHNKMTTQVNPF